MSYIRAHRIRTVILFVLLVFILYASFATVNHTLIAPGYNNEISDTIVIENGSQESGSFHTTSVVVTREMNWIQYVYSFIESRVTTYERPDYYDDLSDDVLDYSSIAMKDDSLATSVVVGYNKAGIDVTYESYLTINLVYNYVKEDTLMLGDKIISVNGTDPFDAINASECLDILTFEVIRNEETLLIDVEKQQLEDGDCRIGISARTYTTVTSASRTYTFLETNTGGPSGGLLQSLYVFNELTEYDYSKGYKIAGTGTINIDGEAGPIGGVREKIITSVMNGVDIFFVPHLSDSENDNYIIARSVLEELDSDMILVPVETLDDCITYLESLEVK